MKFGRWMTIRIVNLMVFLRCLIHGHVWTKTPIVGHVAIYNNSRNRHDAMAATIEHGLHHCQHCGRVEFSPWGASP